MTFESAKLLATSTSAVEWYKSHAHTSFLSEVIQILICANSTWTRYSYASSQTSTDWIFLCTVSSWVCSEPHLCWSEARPLSLSAISESLTARSFSFDWSCFDLALNFAFSVAICASFAAIAVLISASLKVTILSFSSYNNDDLHCTCWKYM